MEDLETPIQLILGLAVIDLMILGMVASLVAMNQLSDVFNFRV